MSRGLGDVYKRQPQPSPPGGEGAVRLLGKGVAPFSLAGRGTGGEGRNTIDPPLGDGNLHVVYTGTSMHPTLIEPELLEVAPYHGRPVRRGDVVYFRPPEEQQELVHRVIAAIQPGTPQSSVHTRGDNSPAADPYRLQPDDIIGRVVVAQRGDRRRPIAGGLRGVLVGTAARLWRTINLGISRFLRGAYYTLARVGPQRRLLPSNLRPRVFVFQARQNPFFKLMMGGRVVGQYDGKLRQWRIRRPFRLFVDEAALPAPGATQDLAPDETSAPDRAE